MSVLAEMSSWLTPATLFLALNLMIGTIAITSRFGGSKRPREDHGSEYGQTPPPLARAPSLIDRVRSINLSLYKFAPSQELEDSGHSYPADPPALARAPSLLDRVRSINFSQFKFPQYYRDETNDEQVNPTSVADRADPVERPRLDRAPSLLERVKSINFSNFKFSQKEERVDAAPIDHPPPLARAPSLLDRFKSIKFSPLYKSEETEGVRDQKPDLSWDKSEKKAAPGTKGRAKAGSASSEKMRKSKSEGARREEEPAGAGRIERWRSSGEMEESVDAKASDFINRFKQELKLQRLDSLRNKMKELTAQRAAKII